MLNQKIIKDIVQEGHIEQYKTNPFFHKVVDFLTLGIDNITENEVVFVISDLCRAIE